MIRLFNLPTGSFMKKNQHRLYQSIATSFIIPTQSSRIKKQEYQMKKKANNVNPYLDDLFGQVKIDDQLNEQMTERILKLQTFLGKEYHLKDELAALALNPWDDNHVQLRYQQERKNIRLSTKSLVRVGETLYFLLNNMLVLNLRSSGKTTEVNELNFERLEDEIYRIMISRNVLLKYLRTAGLRDMVFCGSRPATKFKRAAEKKTLFMIIALISFQHGEERARSFVNSRILYGEGGVWQHAKKTLQRVK